MTAMQTGEDRRGLALAGAGVQVRADGDGGALRFHGHAAVFDSRTAIGNPLTWGFYEEIAPGAFTKTLSEGDARKLIDHDTYYVVSRASAGTLDLAQDKVGLAVDSALDTDLSYVNDLIANLRNGNITGMSFGFYVVKDEWDIEEVETSDGQTAKVEVRRLLELKLVEVSSVTFPAYEETDAGVRARMRAEDEVRAVGLALGRRGREGQELLEARARHCPGLADYRRREQIAASTRGAVGTHATGTDDAAWDGPAAEKALGDDLTAAKARKVYAWQDPDGDPTAKASWKFPHHFVDGDGKPGAASTKACQSGISILNGGQGGSNIPDDDRQGVYNHLAKHLRDAGLEPAELKSATSEPGETTRGDDDTAPEPVALHLTDQTPDTAEEPVGDGPTQHDAEGEPGETTRGRRDVLRRQITAGRRRQLRPLPEGAR